MNNWAIMTPVEQKEVIDRGYDILKNDTIKCANCNLNLLCVLKVKEDKNIQTAIRVRCPFCGDTSFWYKLSGKIYIQAVENLHITNMPVDVRNGVIFTNIEVEENEQKRE